MINIPQREGYVRKLVARRLIEHHDAMGWKALDGKGPDGRYWIGDGVVMEIPIAQYAELTRRSREAYDTARSVMELGGMPTQEVEDGVTIRPTKPKKEKLTVPIA